MDQRRVDEKLFESKPEVKRKGSDGWKTRE
jgi:hypothetical protein